METEKLIATVIKARQGDRDALQALYLDAYMSIYRLALRMVKNPEDAEDITQEVYITIQEKIATLREPAAFYGWVNQITANKCNRLLSKYKGIARLDDDDEFITHVDDDPLNLPDKALDDEASRKIIMEVIDNLPDGQRMCVLLYYYTQNTITQIADILEINENTVKTRLSAARAKIRAALEHKAEKEGIKLWGIPLALTPILRQAIEEMLIPADVQARLLDSISKQTAEEKANDSHGAEQTVNPEAVQAVHNCGAASLGANSAVKTAGKVILGMTAKKVVTAAIIVILAGALITAGVVFLPKMLNPSDPTNTPGVSGTETPGTTTPDNTPGATDTTPDDTTEPSNTPSETEPSTPGTSEPPLYEKPTWYTEYNEERKASEYGEAAERFNGAGIDDIDATLEEIYNKYGKYLHEYFTKQVPIDAIKIAKNRAWVTSAANNSNAANISSGAFEKVNNFLKANGEEQLTDINDPVQSVTAFWLAISMNYSPGVFDSYIEGYGLMPGFVQYYDLAMAVALSQCPDITNLDDLESCANTFIGGHGSLFDLYGWEPE